MADEKWTRFPVMRSNRLLRNVVPLAAESTFLCVGDVDSERSRKVMSEKLHNAGIERVMP